MHLILFHLRLWFCLACLSTISLDLHAGPWIEPGNERTRHHLHVLADSGLLNTPITTWPVSWNSIQTSLNSISMDELDHHTLWSYNYLKHELDKALEPTKVESLKSVAAQRAALTSFSTDSREKAEVRIGLSYTGKSTSLKLQAAYIDDVRDSQTVNLDGSYFAGLFRGWAVGVGAIDRWWGPGWQSSLILSHNARPSPGIFIQRNNSEPFKLPILRALGPWQFTTFMNKLESDRATPDALLFGMRMSIKPSRKLEIGLSRTAQWAGEGRPRDFATFRNLFLGNDNRGDNGISSDISIDSNEPGNQLAGIDWRWATSLLKRPLVFYGQFIGEDEAGGLPSRGIAFTGLESSFVSETVQTRIAFEASDTAVSFYEDPVLYNTAYEHPLYPNGYRYRGRPIAASSDNDANLFTLRGDHYLSNGHQFSWQLIRARLNRDNSNRSTPGGSVFGEDATNSDNIRAYYRLPVSKSNQLELGINYYSDTIEFNDERIKHSGYIRINGYW